MGLFDFFGSKKINVTRDNSGVFSFEVQNSAFGSSQKHLSWSLNNPVLFSIIALRSKMISQMKINIGLK